MRILFATPYYLPELKFGGPPQKIHSIARGLAAAGHEVHVLTFDHGNSASRKDSEIDKVRVQYLPWLGRGLRQLPSDRAILRREINKADVVHCYGLYTTIIPIAARFAQRAGVPVVQEPLGMYPPRARNQIVKWLYNAVITRRMLNSAAAIIAASKVETADLKGFVPVAKIVHRRNGVDVEAFATLPSPENLRRECQISSLDQVVVFVGRLSPIKNLEQLVIAFARAAIPASRLLLVGPTEPEYEKRLRALVKREHISEQVVFAGPLYQEQQKAALALADLFVLPSLSESFGNAAAEAVAAGVPVLLTDTCGIAPLIHRRAGLAVPLGVDSLAEGLRMMLDRKVRDQMTAKREEVKRELSWDEPIAQTIALYERILAERSSRNPYR